MSSAHPSVLYFITSHVDTVPDHVGNCYAYMTEDAEFREIYSLPAQARSASSRSIRFTRRGRANAGIMTHFDSSFAYGFFSTSVRGPTSVGNFAWEMRTVAPHLWSLRLSNGRL